MDTALHPHITYRIALGRHYRQAKGGSSSKEIEYLILSSNLLMTLSLAANSGDTLDHRFTTLHQLRFQTVLTLAKPWRTAYVELGSHRSWKNIPIVLIPPLTQSWPLSPLKARFDSPYSKEMMILSFYNVRMMGEFDEYHLSTEVESGLGDLYIWHPWAIHQYYALALRSIT
ncbi:uncharacterized protein ARMOST_02503 [Armillaria ostoyae]|uniref:Uncharacterized protein n=1 Tax=Armillaria ostoyae TaxID=47428 RepID=A0A284QRW0_ARMOS|nr:uncharacterized protein ARMOST_02503 [Armillaria ostoyae]